ncbi:MAG: hypothetical protein JJ992_30525, partial [Planctomycetes bacterium]|nr:hypothetical protein [Planctomycetota bacterium]
MPAAANAPGGRRDSVAWTDSAGDLWLFGGWSCHGSRECGYFNDLWRYQPDTGLWTWVDGSDSRDQLGVHGVKGVPDAANVPTC